MTELPTVPLKQAPSCAELPPFHVLFRFGKGIPADEQGRVMLAAERWLRERGVAAECYKEVMQDDSKRRRDMTEEQRSNL